MQKSLVIVLALCLISVHAFVKRDVPAAADKQNYLETVQQQLRELKDKVKETFDPEQVKKGLNDFTASLTEAFNDMQKKTAEAPKA